MQRVKLGKSDLEVPVLCLGGNVYGWTLPEADSFRQLDMALEAGLNFIDTAGFQPPRGAWAPGGRIRNYPWQVAGQGQQARKRDHRYQAGHGYGRWQTRLERCLHPPSR